mgnify:CR=1 FL=1
MYELVHSNEVCIDGAMCTMKKFIARMKCDDFDSRRVTSFQMVNDGFGNTLKRSKPFFKKSGYCCKPSEDLITPSSTFHRPQKCKRKSMQENLDDGGPQKLSCT